MIEKGYRVYQIDTKFFKRNIDIVQKKLGLEIIPFSQVIFVKTQRDVPKGKTQQEGSSGSPQPDKKY